VAAGGGGRGPLGTPSPRPRDEARPAPRVARLAQDTTRPLLQTGEPVGDIVDRILAEREPVYGRADVAVTWRGPSPARMVRAMVEGIHAFVRPPGAR
jgi:shikimate kinase